MRIIYDLKLQNLGIITYFLVKFTRYGLTPFSPILTLVVPFLVELSGLSPLAS